MLRNAQQLGEVMSWKFGITPDEQEQWLALISGPTPEEMNVLEYQRDPRFREQINEIVDTIGCSRYRAAKMIRQSRLGVG